MCNMKKMILLLPILFTAFLAKAQTKTLPVDSATHNVVYQEIVNADHITKDLLYTRAREWFARTFVSSKEVIQMDDKDAGKIIGKGSASGINKLGTWASVTFHVDYIVAITVKEGRYRYEISNFSIENDQAVYGVKSIMDINTAYFNKDYRKSNGDLKEKYKDYFIRVYELGNTLSASIKESLSKSLIKSKDDF